MRIAQVAPLYEPVPPALYGGTERIVSYLTEELVRQGHHAFRRASVPEVIEDSMSGCVVDDTASAVRAVARMPTWDRALSRATFERRFTAERMAHDYCQVYEGLRRRAWRLSS